MRKIIAGLSVSAGMPSGLRGRLAAVGIAVLALVAALAAPATAAQAGADSAPISDARPSYVGQTVPTSTDPDGFLPNASADDLAPTCFVTDPDEDFWSKWVDVISNCVGNYRVKVLVAFGPDSSCVYTLSGDQWRHTWYTPGYFDGLVRC